VRGFRYLFVHLRRSVSGLSAGLTVTNVSIHGATATARVTNGRIAQAARFVRSPSGRWQLDCCTGAQTAELATARWRIPSVSMEPTLKPGEVVTSDNAILRTRPPAFGEIVALHSATDTACRDPRQGQGFSAPCGVPPRSEGAVIMIKRVVGLPGDRIALVGGRLVRNGSVAREPYILPCAPGAGPCDFPRPIVVPPHTYFVLGDNRGDSFDSRFFGPVPREWLIGVISP
jgi:signal peptidase I